MILAVLATSSMARLLCSSKPRRRRRTFRNFSSFHEDDHDDEDNYENDDEDNHDNGWWWQKFNHKTVSSPSSYQIPPSNRPSISAKEKLLESKKVNDFY